MKSHSDDSGRIAALEAEIARLTAERDAALAGAVKVKPLVWEQLGDRAWRAPSPFFGSFRVECYGGPWQALWSVPGFCDTFVDGDFTTPDDAKRAIDARICAAIQPDLDARQADLEKAWQPIETAPKDEMILGHASGMIRLVLWEGGNWVQVGATIEAGWYEPTHWMPLPPPPADLAAKIGGE